MADAMLQERRCDVLLQPTSGAGNYAYLVHQTHILANCDTPPRALIGVGYASRVSDEVHDVELQRV